MPVVRTHSGLATCEMCKHFRKAEGGRGLCAALVKIVRREDPRCSVSYEPRAPRNVKR